MKRYRGGNAKIATLKARFREERDWAMGRTIVPTSDEHVKTNSSGDIQEVNVAFMVAKGSAQDPDIIEEAKQAGKSPEEVTMVQPANKKRPIAAKNTQASSSAAPITGPAMKGTSPKKASVKKTSAKMTTKRKAAVAVAEPDTDSSTDTDGDTTPPGKNKRHKRPEKPKSASFTPLNNSTDEEDDVGSIKVRVPRSGTLHVSFI